MRDLLGFGKGDLAGQEDLFAVVPLGVPLLAGPALLTTSLIVSTTFGLLYVLTALVLNLLIAGAVFKYSLMILRLVSRRWVEAISIIIRASKLGVASPVVERKMISVICPFELRTGNTLFNCFYRVFQADGDVFGILFLESMMR